MNKNEIIDFVINIISPESIDVSNDRFAKMTMTNWADFIEIANKNFVAPIIYQKLKLKHNIDLFPLTVKDQISRNAQIHLMKNLRINSVFIQICKILKDHKVDFILLKGIDLQYRLYQNPALRPMLDIDILLKDKDVDKVTNHFISLGAKQIRVSESKFIDSLKHHDSPIIFNQIAIEFHRSIVDSYDITKLGHLNIWDYSEYTVIEGIEVKVLIPELLIIYLCHHIFSTIQGGKIKLFWYYDIFLFFETFRNSLNEELILSLLEKTGEPLIFYKTLSQVKSIFASTCFPQKIDDHLFEVDRNEIFQAMLAIHVTKVPPHYIMKFKLIRGFSPKAKYIFHKFFPSISYINDAYKPSNHFQFAFLYLKHQIHYLNLALKAFLLYLYNKTK